MIMGKTCKIVVCGAKKSGKTAILEQAIYGKIGPFQETCFEDTYETNIETDRGTVEAVRFYDTEGVDTQGQNVLDKLPRHIIAVADGCIIVYSVDDEKSFQIVDAIRKEIDSHKEKKDFVILVLGNKSDSSQRKVESVQALNWAAREKVKLFELKTLVMEEDENRTDCGCCSGCHLMLREPFLQCQQCSSPNKNICTSCFSKGREFSHHESDHSFVVVNSSFHVLDPEWSAGEEVQLLNNLLKFGHGNWDDIAKAIPRKTARECEDHFGKFYLDNATGDFGGQGGQDPGRRDEPFKYTTQVDLPKKSVVVESGDFYGARIVRPVPGSQTHREVAGYNAARSEFESEFDNGFEVHLSPIESNKLMYEVVERGMEGVIQQRPLMDDKEEEDYLEACLNVSLLDLYRNKIKQRTRRKRLVKEYGLLNKPKAISLPSRYPHINHAGPKYESIYRFGSKVMCSVNFDFLLEGLHHDLMLRQQILHLQEYRESGIQRYSWIDVFRKMKALRTRQVRDLSTLTETIRDWELSENLNKGHVTFYNDPQDGSRLVPTLMGSTRRSAAPMNIVGLPGYDKLNSDERDLCSENRVLPEVFLEVKGIMTDECTKNNGLRLADIRPLVKIDVNKTKIIYSYFLKAELIHTPKGLMN